MKSGLSFARRRSPLSSERGVSLLEMVFAVSLILVVSLGLLPLGVIATTTTENQGHLMARSTEYAQDKLEQLLALKFDDLTSDTREFPAPDSGGSGLATGGSKDPAAPDALYSDYLDEKGNLLDASAGAPNDWFYKRVWLVEDVNASLKRITVVGTVRHASGSIGKVPRATVASLKTFPF